MIRETRQRERGTVGQPILEGSRPDDHRPRVDAADGQAGSASPKAFPAVHSVGRAAAWGHLAEPRVESRDESRGNVWATVRWEVRLRRRKGCQMLMGQRAIVDRRSTLLCLSVICRVATLRLLGLEGRSRTLEDDGRDQTLEVDGGLLSTDEDAADGTGREASRSMSKEGS